MTWWITTISEADIRNLLRNADHGLVERTENQNVVDDVKRYIQLQQNKNITVTMKTLRDNYVGKEPYGFVNEDPSGLSHVYLKKVISVFLEME